MGFPFQKPWVLALLTGTLPVLVVAVCTTYSMRHGLTARCFPLLEGCTSISAACRSVPVIYLFRAVMLPCSVLLVMYWLVNDHWLQRYSGVKPRRRQIILMCGLLGALFLVLYVFFLGTKGEIYSFLRRFGVYVFFAGTAIAQLLTAVYQRKKAFTFSTNAQLFVVILMLLLGPLNLILKAILENPDGPENVIEWYFGLLLCLYFIFSAHLWRVLKFSAGSRSFLSIKANLKG